MVGLFFGLLLTLGLALHRDYGVSWDEVNNHLNGLVNLKYVAQRLLPELAARPPFNQRWIPELLHYKDRDHGALFEMLTSVLGAALTDGDSRSFYFLRHLCVFLTFGLGVWALYGLGRARFGDWRLGLLVAAALVASPRLFAEAFYNGKDVVYMALYTLAMLTLLRLLRRPTAGRALLHALATAAAIDVRAHALHLLLVTGLMLALEARLGVAEAPAGPRPRYGRLGGLYAGAALVFAVLGWPYLWAAPLPDLLRFGSGLRSYGWGHSVLYWGRFVSAAQVPWHYAPVWLAVTTPLPYVLAGLLGLGAALRGLLRTGRLRHRAGRLDLLLLLWFAGPLLAVMALGSALYDGWRHLYFVYPALLLLAVRGGLLLVRWARTGLAARRVALALAVGAGIGVAHTVARMVQLHPLQNVYFSVLPAAAAERLFERDYWGLAYRQGLEWVLAHDAAPRLTVSTPHYVPFYNNSLILPPADRARLRFATRAEGTAAYFLTGYRWHPQSYADSLGREVHAIRAGGVKVLSVFRRGGALSVPAAAGGNRSGR